MRIAEISLDNAGLEIVLRRNLEHCAARFFKDAQNLALLTKFRNNLIAARSLPFPLVLWAVQNRCYELLQKLDPNADPRWLAECHDLAGLLQLAAEPRP